MTGQITECYPGYYCSMLKLFKTSNMHIASNCLEQLNFALPSVQLARRAEKFLTKLHVH